MNEKKTLDEETSFEASSLLQKTLGVSACKECDCEKFEHGGLVGTVCAAEDCGHGWSSHVR